MTMDIRYIAQNPDSVIANNLKACNQFRQYNGRVAEDAIRPIIEMISNSNAQNPYFNIVKHNTVVFRDGDNALEILPRLVGKVPEARLNLVIHYLRYIFYFIFFFFFCICIGGML